MTLPVVDRTDAAAVAAFRQGRSRFTPRKYLGHGHVMTVYAWARRRQFPALPPPESRLFRVTPDSEVMARCFWQPDRRRAPAAIVLHGLEGSSEVHYMRGVADKAWRRGWNVVLLNQRNCGGTEHLAPGLYHSGLTDDPRAVMRTLAAVDGIEAFGVVGYSLGGNLAVKLAGEESVDPTVPLRAVVAVCPTIDLDRCVHAIERRSNIPYHFNFVRNLRARMRRKAAAWPGAFDVAPLPRIWTIRRFDDIYTAPFHGFGNALNYYRLASAIRIVESIRIPTLIVAAEDDPFVPPEQFRDPAVRNNPYIATVIEPHGGHCGFIAEARDGDDGYWAESEAAAFLDAFTPRSTGAPAADR